jgi:MazG family protein
MGKPFPPVDSVPLSEQKGQSFPRLVELMQRLLAPDGCPWDRKQSFESLRKYVIEEAHEVASAIDDGDQEAICEELGDLVLQVVFQAELGRAAGTFGPDDVIKGIVDKLVRRHPHVFADVEADDAETVLRNWEKIKSEEKGQRPVLDGVPPSLPALLRAQRVGEKVERVGFDWPDMQGSRAKVSEELAELDEAIAAKNQENIEEELGDLLFALVNLARHARIDAEGALRGTISKFQRRFNYVEQEVLKKYGAWPSDSQQKIGQGVSLEEMDRYWEAAKAIEKSSFDE